MGAVLFLGVVLIVVFLCISLGKGKKGQRSEEFNKLMLEVIRKSTPLTENFNAVMAQSSSDGNKERISTGYASAPGFVIGYNSQEMYVVCVGEHPSASKMEPDKNFILHFTPENLENIKFGMGGKITFKLKDTPAVFVVTVTDFAVSMLQQPENHKHFAAYIKDFAKKYNLES